MDATPFTAGITFRDDRALTVDVTAIDAAGVTYTADTGPVTVPWEDVKALMLATTDHMLETGGSLMTMAEVLREAGDRTDQAAEMRRFGLDVLQQAAPRVCPLGAACGLRPAPASDGGA